jgi:DNA-binding transcriptional ArsR family regulator
MAIDARHGRIPATLLCDPNVPAESKALYALLEMHAGPAGCFPSQELVGRMMGVDQRTIRRWLAPLEREGHITVTPKYDRRGMRAGVQYRLLATVRQLAQRAELAYTDAGSPATTGVAPDGR